jgi:hypothetical protein
MVQTRSASARAAASGLHSVNVSPKKRKTSKGNIKKKPTKNSVESRQLSSFHCFEKLPIELRVMIWKMTMVPRIVEVSFSPERGFHTRTITPIALRACPDSRSAALHAYQICFGNMLYPPRILLNFSIDTIYLHTNMNSEVMLLFTGLQPHEANNLRRIAISEDINRNWYDGEDVEVNAFDVIKMAVPFLPALRSIQFVCSLAHRIDKFDEDNGALRLYESWPDYLMDAHAKAMESTYGVCYWPYCPEDFSDDDDLDGFGEWLCECHDLPDGTLPELLGGIKGVKITSIWGWRPETAMRPRQF